ncbi:MAG: tetratricopeptide repeat protein [Acidobacteriaceae bacterium]
MRIRLASATCVAALAAFLGAPPAQPQAKAEPTSGDPLLQARTLAVEGKLVQSEDLLHELLSKQPSSADAHFLLGYVFFREEKPRDSLAEFTAGARTRRPSADDFRIIASDYVLLHDYGDAAKWFSEVAAETPNDPEAWYLLGRAQYNNQSFRDAIVSFQHALHLRPKYIEAENNMGLAWQGLNQPTEAKAAFATAVEWQGGHPSDAQPFLNLGALLSQQNQVDRALHYLRIAAGLAPNNPKVHEELGRAYEDTGRLPEAGKELGKAAVLAPNVSALHYELGRIYQREGFRDRAREQFAICAQLNGSHSSAETPDPFGPD